MGVGEGAGCVQRQRAVLRALDEERAERQVVRIAVVIQDAERADAERATDCPECVKVIERRRCIRIGLDAEVEKEIRRVRVGGRVEKAECWRGCVAACQLGHAIPVGIDAVEMDRPQGAGGNGVTAAWTNGIENVIPEVGRHGIGEAARGDRERKPHRRDVRHRHDVRADVCLDEEVSRGRDPYIPPSIDRNRIAEEEAVDTGLP